MVCYPENLDRHANYSAISGQIVHAMATRPATSPWQELQPIDRGFTTNPSLLKKAGVRDLRAYARDLVAAVPGPAYFLRSVLAMTSRKWSRRARTISAWRQERLREAAGHQYPRRAALRLQCARCPCVADPGQHDRLQSSTWAKSPRRRSAGRSRGLRAVFACLGASMLIGDLLRASTIGPLMKDAVVLWRANDAFNVAPTSWIASAPGELFT